MAATNVEEAQSAAAPRPVPRNLAGSEADVDIMAMRLDRMRVLIAYLGEATGPNVPPLIDTAILFLGDELVELDRELDELRAWQCSQL